MLLYNHYATLNRLKQEYAPFSTTDFTTSFTGAIKTLRLTKNGETAFIVGNFDVNSQLVSLTLPNSGRWYEFFRQDSVDISTTNLSITLGPGQYRMYTNTKIVQADTYTIAPIIPTVETTLSLNVYPNPSSGESVSVAITTSAPIRGEVSLYNISGAKVMSLYHGLIADGEIMQLPSSLQSGIYFIQVKTQSQQITKKLVVY